MASVSGIPGEYLRVLARYEGSYCHMHNVKQIQTSRHQDIPEQVFQRK
jgi:hypothetical protein